MWSNHFAIETFRLKAIAWFGFKHKFIVIWYCFLATRGQSYSGDIAIDDLQFTGCGLPVKQKCKPEEFTCKRGSCTKKSYLCDFNDDCGDNSDETNCGMF